MARLAKPGEFINCKISIDLVKKLDEYMQKTRLSKTAVIEMALAKLFDETNVLDDRVE